MPIKKDSSNNLKEKQNEEKKLLIENNNPIRKKMDREYDFKQFNKKGQKEVDILETI
jgi:hypothetical protein